MMLPGSIGEALISSRSGLWKVMRSVASGGVGATLVEGMMSLRTRFSVSGCNWLPELE